MWLTRCVDKIRAGDVAARLGGDEFAALLTRIDPDEVRLLAERLQRQYTEFSALQLTVSIGVAWYDGDRRRTMLNADAALYRAKASGRNLTCITGAHTEHPDLIVPDILMPTMNGYELVQDLRGESSTADLPEAFSTATHAVDAVRRLASAFCKNKRRRGNGGIGGHSHGAGLVARGHAVASGARSPRHGGGRGIERGDRRSACDRRCDGAIPREAHPAQAGCQKPHRGGRHYLRQ